MQIAKILRKCGRVPIFGTTVTNQNYASAETFTAVMFEVDDFWVVTPCSVAV
jgi:hypothetical protein